MDMVGRLAWRSFHSAAASRQMVVACAGTVHKRFLATPADPRNICDKIAFIGAGNMAKAIMGKLKADEPYEAA